MAYGNSKNLQRRAIPTGKRALDATDLPSGKLADLKILRERYLAAANSFVGVVFTEEPLTGTLSQNDMHDILLVKHKEISGLNKAYVEKARLSVPNAIRQVEDRYLNSLYGRLLHCASPTGETDPAKRLYLNIPLELQDKVTSQQLEQMEKKYAGLGYKDVLQLVRDVVVDNKTDSLCLEEVLVVKAIHAECRERYRKPVFGSDPRFTCQIHLDYRVIRNKVDPVPELDRGARILVDKANRKFHHFLEISNPLPRGKAIRIPLAMSNKALKQFDENSAVSSLLVEIGPDAVTVGTIIAKPEGPVPGLDGITHLIGRDFGMVNTVSLTVVKIDKEISREEVDRISAFSRQEALKYLEGNSHTGDNVVQRIRFSGRKFLDAIKSQCDRIDYLLQQAGEAERNPLRPYRSCPGRYACR